MAKVFRAALNALLVALKFLAALWLAAFYGMVGDIEGFERWRNWFEGRNKG